MCVLKIHSDVESFKSFAGITKIPVYSFHEKGEFKNKTKNLKWTDYRISFDVSEKDWDDFEGQTNDAIKFLKTHYKEIKAVLANNNISSAYLDFPIYSRLNGNIVNQNDHLPKELIKLCGELFL